MENTSTDGPGRTIQSLEIALNIIDVLQERGGAGVTELADELGHSKSTVHSHLRTLEQHKIIVRDGDYRLSLRVLDIANHVREQAGNYEVIRKEVDTLAQDSGEIAQFGIEEYGQVSYLYKATGERAVETASTVGTQQPIYSTALGKTILTYLPPERTREVVEATEFTELTPETITSSEELYAELDVIEEQGYGIDDEENFGGLRCVAAPVRNGDTVLGAVSITGPSSRFSDDRLHGEFSEAVKRAANVIELNTKFA